MPTFLVKAKIQKLFVIDAPSAEDAESQVGDIELESFLVLETTQVDTSNTFIDMGENLSVNSGNSLRVLAPEEVDNIIKDEDGGDQ